jgi:CRP-like cAMP-binding protein
VTHSLVQGLRAVPSLAPLPEETLLTIVGDSANLFWPARSVVFTKGSPADGLYFIVSGEVQVLDGAGAEVAVLGAGNFFGEMSLLFGTAHQHEVRATEDAELMVVPRERFEQLLADNPELARSVRQKAEERMAAAAEAGAQQS